MISFVQKVFDYRVGGISLFKSLFTSVFFRVVNASVAFSLSIVLARLLGVKDFGIYSYVISLITLISVPAQCGISELLVRETAKIQAKKNFCLLHGLWKWGDLVTLSSSILLIGIVWGILITFPEQFDNERGNALLLALPLVPLLAFVNLKSSCIRGLRFVIIGQVPVKLLVPLFLLVLIFVIEILFNDKIIFDKRAAISAHILAAGLALVCAIALLRKYHPVELSKTIRSEYECGKWFGAILPFTFINGLHLINSSADILILGLFCEDSTVGVYKAVAQLSALVTFGLEAVNRVLHPHFSRLNTLGRSEELQKIVSASAGVIFLFAIPPVLLFSFYGSEVLTLFFGSSFIIGAQPLMILLLGQLVNASMGSVGALLTMTGHERYTMRGVFAAAVINIILNVTLIPFFGMTGAAISTAVSVIVWNIILKYYVQKTLNIESSGLYILKLLKR